MRVNEVQEEMKVAVVLRCISGQLLTYINIQLSEGLKYEELREALFKWDRCGRMGFQYCPTS